MLPNFKKSFFIFKFYILILKLSRPPSTRTLTSECLSLRLLPISVAQQFKLPAFDLALTTSKSRQASRRAEASSARRRTRRYSSTLPAVENSTTEEQAFLQVSFLHFAQLLITLFKITLRSSSTLRSYLPSTEKNARLWFSAPKFSWRMREAHCFRTSLNNDVFSSSKQRPGEKWPYKARVGKFVKPPRQFALFFSCK